MAFTVSGEAGGIGLLRAERGLDVKEGLDINHVRALSDNSLSVLLNSRQFNRVSFCHWPSASSPI